MNKVSLVDDVDWEFLHRFKWRTNLIKRCGNCYGTREIWNKGNRYSEHLHRVVLERKIGRKLTKKEQVDHIDGNGLNNTRNNLRLSNQCQNMANARKRKDNLTGVRGVHFNKAKNKFEVYINKNRKRFRLGRYKTLKDATKVREEAEKKFYGEFRHVQTN